MKQLTVFTPSYNRAYLLPRLYESLLKQTNKTFIWLIIDDGSSDNTSELVMSWIKEGHLDIRYKFQENLGMHGAHNTAYELIDTELNVCIDSDDLMPENAVEMILNFWDENKSEDYAGILGLDAFKNGEIVSNRKFPENIKSGKYFELKSKHKLKGDIKFVYRTDIIKQFPPYPIFTDEKFVPLGYKYMLIDQKYNMLFLNKVLCIVEYMEDGSTMNIFKQYVRNPKGFSHERKMRIKYSYSFIEKVKNSIHYVSSAIFSMNSNFIRESTNKLLTIMVIPLGIILNIYIRLKIRKS